MAALDFDVAVIGGGPAGCSTAIQLVARGCRVALAEASDYSTRRVGETLASALSSILDRLGVSTALLESSHLRCAGLRCRWGDDEPIDRSFVFNPYGGGWHVDRAAFDRMLFDAAAVCGVQAIDAAPLRALYLESARWNIELGGPSPRRLTAQFVVDATGRRACVARRQGARRRMQFPMLATIGWFALAPEAPRPAVTQIEAAPDGWWYCAPLPHNEAVMVRFTLPEPRFARSGSVNEQHAMAAQRFPGWNDALCGAFPLANNTCRAESSLLEPVHGPMWLAVGDAALTVDPLSGDGVLRSMTMGAAAAHAIVAHLGGSPHALEEYAESVVRCDREYAASEQLLYSREQRWYAAPFWARRHSALPAQ